MKPSVVRSVHYRSYGTPNGEYTPECRAAIIAEVHDEQQVTLAVLNPSGVFFKKAEYDRTGQAPGSWHWPERVD